MPVNTMLCFPAVKDAASSGHATIKAVTLRIQGSKCPNGKNGRDHAAYACVGPTGKDKKDFPDEPWGPNQRDRELDL